ncbi:NUDIX domain-containing protein [Rothia aerolata]|uniref:ADP-ribose pyrophosphatase n=1 Tax=Rothia aerolata TaxID=1812262 RepID=A0A917MQQ0_9MICC|nr:NUDIX hydrolase [Rothia aerolata]GGH58650.1 ADP-ribose pyrophosphatase [Rothia aerolata]
MADTYLSHDELVAFIATLPTRRLASAALIRDPQNRILAVKPNYRDGWSLPGGTVEAGEAPKEGCFREVEEEVGLSLEPGRVLTIFHGLQQGVWGDSTYYIYDGGVIDADTKITLQEEELVTYEWLAQDQFDEYFGPHFATRLRDCFRALETGEVIETSSGENLHQK